MEKHKANRRKPHFCRGITCDNLFRLIKVNVALTVKTLL